MARWLFKIEWPPPKLLMLIAVALGAFLLLEGLLFQISKDIPLKLALWEILFWIFLLIWSIRIEVRLPLSASMSQLFLFALALVVLTPPWFAPLLVFLAQWRGKVWYKELFNRSQNGLATALAALTWHFFQQNPVYLGPWNLSAGVGIATASLAFFAVNTTLVTTAVHLANNITWREAWRKNFSWLALSYLLLSPIALLLARAYETPLLGNWGGWTVLLFLIPLYYSRYYWDEKVRLEEAYEATLETLMHALEAKDPQTRLHSERVAEIARDLAKKVKKGDEAYAQAVYRAARLHDIGKIGIPEFVLLKPGPLTPEEREAIEKHPEFGAEMLKPGAKVAFEPLV
ncbi:HD-GYP domain-containing protein, partial [Fervidobacterium sp.]